MDIKEESKASDANDSKKKNKRHRKRFKALYQPIIKQMEFYFGDANLGKSKFMVAEMEKEGAEGRFIPLDVFLKFNKLRGMLASAVGSDAVEAEMKEFLWNAVSKTPSDLLDTREDDDGARWLGRSTVFNAGEDGDVDECTLYVERIPPQMGTVEAMETAFGKYGRVVYVSLPKFKRDGKVKGFAFVQFEKPAEAQKALDAMSGDKGETAVKSMDPGELESIKSYQEEQLMELKEEEGRKAKKRKSEDATAAAKDVSIKSEPEGDEDDDSDSPPTKKIKSEEGEEKAKKKKVRKRKKSVSGHVNGNGTGPPAQPVWDASSLRVMSKASWKRLRNQYLNEQRKNMTESKRRLKQWREGQDKQQHSGKEALLPPPPPPPPRPSFAELPFVPKTIVKFSLAEPIDDKQMLKKKVRSAFLFPVTYVDADVGKSEYHVRCSDEEQAKKLAGVTCLGNASILTGDEVIYVGRFPLSNMEGTLIDSFRHIGVT